MAAYCSALPGETDSAGGLRSVQASLFSVDEGELSLRLNRGDLIVGEQRLRFLGHQAEKGQPGGRAVTVGRFPNPTF